MEVNGGIVLLVGRLVIAALLLTAGVTKLVDRGGTRGAIEAFGVPATAVTAIATMLPIAEIALAIALLPAAVAVAGAIGASLLLLGFSIAIAGNLAAGRHPECHCFGQLHSSAAGWGTLMRNLLLAVVAAAIAVAGPGPSAVSWIGGLGAGTAIVMLAAIAAASAVGVLGFQLLRQHGQLLIRIDALEAALVRHGIEIPDTALDSTPVFVPGIPVGDSAPPFELSAEPAGDTVTLGGLLSTQREVLLVFADPGCGPCRELMPRIARWQREDDGEPTVALINSGDRGQARAMAEEFGVERLLVDPDRQVSEAYGVNATPAAVLVGLDGTVQSPVAQGEAAVSELAEGSTSQPAPLDVVKVRGASRFDSAGGTGLGKPLPDLVLADLDGAQFDLGEVRGTESALLFWNPACGFCQAMLDRLREWEDEPPPNAQQLLIVSSGGTEANRAQRLRSTILLDEGFAVGMAVGAGGTPMAVLVDEDGRIASGVAAGEDAVLALLGEWSRSEVPA